MNTASRKFYASLIKVAILISLVFPGGNAETLGAASDFQLSAHNGYTFTEDGSPFYYYQHQPVKMSISTDKIMLRMVQGGNVDAIHSELKAANLADNLATQKAAEISDGITMIDLRERLPLAEYMQTLQDASALNDVELVGPVFEIGSTTLLVTDEVIVQFKQEATSEQINGMVKQLGATIKRKYPYADNNFILSFPQRNSLNILNEANYLAQQWEWVQYAHPNFIMIGDFASHPSKLPAPNDRYYEDEWYLDNSSNYQNDINAPEAWMHTMGSPNIVIAIVDEGTDVGHEDLKDKIFYQWDTEENDADPTPPLVVDPYKATLRQIEGHGTAVSGIAAATGNNDGKGVIGVCPNCQLMPIRMCSGIYYFNPEKSEYKYKWVCLIDRMSAAIDIAWMKGADVINSSWTWYETEQITLAISRATNMGRGGKGAVVVAGTGNDNTNQIAFPARLPNVIAVGATNFCNQLKHIGDNDCSNGDGKWGSNYGTELSVVAPGTWLYTTDIHGEGGMDPTDYTHSFNGTSGATPIVSGIAGLILSANPELNYQQVRSVIEDTATAIGSSYVTGHGLVNAHAAVIKAAELIIPTLTIQFLDSGTYHFYRNRQAELKLFRTGFGSFLEPIFVDTQTINDQSLVNFTLTDVPSGEYVAWIKVAGSTAIRVVKFITNNNNSIDLQAVDNTCRVHDPGAQLMCLGDINSDNKVNTVDLEQWTSCYYSPAQCQYPLADTNNNGIMGEFIDIAPILSNYGSYGDTLPMLSQNLSIDTDQVKNLGGSLRLNVNSTSSSTSSTVPQVPTVAVGEVVTLTMQYDTAGRDITSIDTVIHYDHCALRLLSDRIRQFGSFETTTPITKTDTLDYGSYVNINQGTPPVNGSGMLLQIPFEALADPDYYSKVTIEFRSNTTSDSNIVEQTTNSEILENVYDASINIASDIKRPKRTVEFTWPNQYYINQDQIMVSVNAYDPCGEISEVAFYTGGGFQYMGSDKYGADGWNYVWDVSQLPDGPVDIFAFASDAAGAGNIYYFGNGEITPMYFYLDRQKPVIQKFYADTLSGIPGSPVNIYYEINDAQSGFDRADIYVRQTEVAESVNMAWKFIGTVSSNDQPFIWNRPSEFSGMLEYKLIAMDKAGNYTYAYYMPPVLFLPFVRR